MKSSKVQNPEILNAERVVWILKARTSSRSSTSLDRSPAGRSAGAARRYGVSAINIYAHTNTSQLCLARGEDDAVHAVCRAEPTTATIDEFRLSTLDFTAGGHALKKTAREDTVCHVP